MEQYVAALDLGTFKMIAMAARKTVQGLSILDKAKTESNNCIRRGCIYNIEKTSDKVAALIADLNKKVKAPVEKIYVGIGGQSLKTQKYSAVREVNGIVTQDMLNSLETECREYQPLDVDVLDIVSIEYYLDGRPESYPKGASCRNIEMKALLITGNPSLKNYLEKSVKDKVEIAGFFISPLATAAAVLSDAEKEQGCALVEFGAGITYVSVYKDKLLRYMIAIPLGGDIITQDIIDLGVTRQEAEELKINYGSALLEKNNEGTITTGSQKSIDIQKLNTIIEARMDEILANVIAQLNKSGYTSSLGAGIVITGGGASLKNVRLSLQEKARKDVRISSTKKTLGNQVTDLTTQPENATIVGLLSLGKENCAKERAWTAPDPVVKTSTLIPPPSTPPTPTPPSTSPIDKENEKEKERKRKKKGPNFLDIWAGKLFGDEELEESDNKEEKNIQL
jgi:cell division protein FtsA